MNIAKYIVSYIEKKHIDTVFMVTGGQAMFLNDAVYSSKKIRPIFHHHEQAAAMAAEAYGRISGTVGVAMVTAGPAGVNALNGVVGAYTDSAPMIVIAGQSSSGNAAYMEKTGIRQYGLQGIHMKPLVTSITKYYVSIDDPLTVSYHLEKAWYLASHGRPGPVWIDVPLDMQRTEMPEIGILHFSESELKTTQEMSDADLDRIVTLLGNAKRPVCIAGHGISIAGASRQLDVFLKKTRMPVVTTRLGIDLVDSSSPQFVGRPGLYGDRPANFAIQSADFILAIGARLDPGIVGYDAGDWGRRAFKVIVDIDQKELDKPGIEPSVRVLCDAKVALTKITDGISKMRLPSYATWMSRCAMWKTKYPMNLPEYKKEKKVNSYLLSDRLSNVATARDTVVVDTSSPFHVVCQTWKIKKGQRFITTGGISTMGYWPASIGACMARPKGQTIVITGDGCLQMNLQELATVKQNKLNLKIFVINNNGYLLIRHTQKTHLEGRLMGESPKTGLYIPDSIKIAKAYGIKSVRISTPRGIDRTLQKILAYEGPMVIDVVSPEWQLIIPRVSSEKTRDGRLISKPFEDLYPFLPREEFAQMTAIE